MEWVDRLQGEVIGLDTAPIIYLIEEHPIYLEPMRYFFEALERGSFRAITSTVTLLEVLVQPLRENNVSLAEEYRDILLNASNSGQWAFQRRSLSKPPGSGHNTAYGPLMQYCWGQQFMKAPPFS